MVRFTDRAIHKVRTIQQIENKSGQMLRLGVESGCCSQFTFIMRFDDGHQPDDNIFHFNEIKVVIDSQSLPYLSGLEIDYLEEEGREGFLFNNPNARRSCACGNSFDA